MNNYLNITQSPHLIHSDLKWTRIRDILIKEGLFNEHGFPKQSFVDNEFFSFDAWNPNQVTANQDGIDLCKSAVNRYNLKHQDESN